MPFTAGEGAVVWLISIISWIMRTSHILLLCISGAALLSLVICRSKMTSDFTLELSSVLRGVPSLNTPMIHLLYTPFFRWNRPWRLLLQILPEKNEQKPHPLILHDWSSVPQDWSHVSAENLNKCKYYSVWLFVNQLHIIKKVTHPANLIFNFIYVN